jgi:hypothetical protein
LAKTAIFYEAEVDEMVAGLSSLSKNHHHCVSGDPDCRNRGVHVPADLQIGPGRLMLLAASMGPGFITALALILGLLSFSFLRCGHLPGSQDDGYQWAAECAELNSVTAAANQKKFNLLTPRYAAQVLVI